MKKLNLILPDVIAVIFFAVLSYLYFFPADSDGRILAQHDSIAGIGAGRKLKSIRKKQEKSLVGRMLCLVVCLLIRWLPVIILPIL